MLPIEKAKEKKREKKKIFLGIPSGGFHVIFFPVACWVISFFLGSTSNTETAIPEKKVHFHLFLFPLDLFRYENWTDEKDRFRTGGDKRIGVRGRVGDPCLLIIQKERKMSLRKILRWSKEPVSSVSVNLPLANGKKKKLWNIKIKISRLTSFSSVKWRLIQGVYRPMKPIISL